MKTRREVELEAAVNIARTFPELVAMVKRLIPPSKRGSNLERVLADMDAKATAIEQCLADAALAKGAG